MRIEEITFDQIWQIAKNDVPYPKIITPYQSMDYILSYFGGKNELDKNVLIFEVQDDNQVSIAVLFLYKRTFMGISILYFIGRRNNNINFPWVHSNIEIDRKIFIKTIKSYMRINGHDLLVLENAPEIWNGVENPLWVGSPSRSADFLHVYDKRVQGGQAVPRIIDKKQIRNKERYINRNLSGKFKEAVGYSEVKMTIDAFLTQRKERKTLKGVGNYYDSQDKIDQLTRASMSLEGRTPSIKWSYLEIDGRICATYATMSDENCESAILNSVCTSEISRHGPGIVLLRNIVFEFMRSERLVFEIGVGHMRYKDLVCNAVVPLYNIAIAGTIFGILIKSLLTFKWSVRRMLKQSNAVMSILRQSRRLVSTLRN